jgi:hypothetical protein
MSDAKYQLAELNIAQMLAPIDDPVMADFANNLVKINTLAETQPGFVWRLQTEDGDATALRVFEHEYIIVNMSVWESIEALYDFAYKSEHTDFFRRRREWFEKMETPVVVLWWIKAGHIPTVEEAKAKLEHLLAHGPTPQAFTFKQRYSVEDMLVEQVRSSE